MLKRGSAGKVFPECEILQNLRPAQYIMPLTSSILFPNTHQHTPCPPPLSTPSSHPARESRREEEEEEIGPVAKAAFSAAAPARSI